MRQLQEYLELNKMSDQLQESLQEEPIEEGVIGDFFKKTFTYFKSKVAQIGKFFVALWNGEPLSAILPITSQKAWMDKAFADTDAVHMVGTRESAKISNVPTNFDAVIQSRGGSIQAAMDRLKKFGKRTYECRYDLMNQNLITEEIRLAHDDPAFKNLNVDTPALQMWIKKAIQKPLSTKPLLIWGAPGIGKTKIIQQVVKSTPGKEFIDVQLSLKEHDDFFLPGYIEKNGEKNATDLPKSWLPVYKITGDPEKDKKADEACGSGLIFFDEISRAKPQTLAVCLKMIDERKLGEEYRLGSQWTIIAASNREEDDLNQRGTIGAALGNRFMQLNYAPTYKSWRKWADTKKYMNRDILNWLECNEKYFYYSPDANNGDASVLFASPRAWEYACQTLANWADAGDDEGFDLDSIPDELICQSISAAVGSEPADAFMEFLKLKRSVDIEALKKVWTDPSKAPLPQKKGGTYKLDMMYIITTQILSLRSKQIPTPEEFNNLCRYYVRLDNESAVAKMLHMLTDMHPQMNELFGEMQGKVTYMEGIDILSQHYTEYSSIEDWKNLEQ